MLKYQLIELNYCTVKKKRIVNTTFLLKQFKFNKYKTKNDCAVIVYTTKLWIDHIAKGVCTFCIM